MDANEILTNSAAAKDEENIKKAIAENDLIFVGSVIDLGEPPSYWSGYFPAYQSVRYEVEQVLKGHWTEKQITADHVVVQNSKTAEPGSDPRLSSKFFSVGTRIIVFAMKAKDGSWKNLHQQWGVHPASNKVLDLIRHLLSN